MSSVRYFLRIQNMNKFKCANLLKQNREKRKEKRKKMTEVTDNLGNDVWILMEKLTNRVRVKSVVFHGVYNAPTILRNLQKWLLSCNQRYTFQRLHLLWTTTSPSVFLWPDNLDYNSCIWDGKLEFGELLAHIELSASKLSNSSNILSRNLIW